ncbi:hypothetical protein [Streptomyces camelliae]|uniref:Fluoride ion transporter CrcB n=1 Tax=Streptomyces camelliae TaxID=3004093 RepID=A0ABY7P5K4_9ACTN|nr:hypothetical protein [Streptomyces sp. HUAS 2-6]WBO64804.1 hypothetical protein O1G22_19175 [Streptomyces sp. HUAS 2-6]
MNWLLVVVGAMVGAPLRYLTDRAVQKRLDTVFPYSAFSYEALRPAEDGARFFAAANVVASVVAGLGAAFVGVSFAQALWA